MGSGKGARTTAPPPPGAPPSLLVHVINSRQQSVAEQRGSHCLGRQPVIWLPLRHSVKCSWLTCTPPPPPPAGMGVSTWTHLANGEGSCPPPCGPDTEQ